MKLFKTSKGIILQSDSRNYFLKDDWDELLTTIIYLNFYHNK